jgi:hypothetical protein
VRSIPTLLACSEAIGREDPLWAITVVQVATLRDGLWPKLCSVGGSFRAAHLERQLVTFEI